MIDDTEERDAILQLGMKPSIVESFTINGLYGYRSISLSSSYASTILIARNGSGKTTLLGALDAFLRGHFTRLRDIPFDHITCKLRNYDYDLVLTYADLQDFMDGMSLPEFVKLSRQVKSDSWTIFRFLIEDYEDRRHEFPTWNDDNDIYNILGRAFDFNRQNIVETCDKVRSLIFMKNQSIGHLSILLSEAFSDIDIVYLPTYRRIELPLVVDTDERQVRTKKRLSLKFGGSSLFTGDIQFGLTDISDRLAQLNSSISAESSYGYREISANIINELIDNEDAVFNSPTSEIPTKQELELFFSRIKGTRYLGPFNEYVVPSIDKIYSGNVSQNTRRFLQYYLTKLDKIIKSTKDVESRVVDFVAVCNTYLNTLDNSTDLSSDAVSESQYDYDSKSLVLDRKNFSIHVVNTLTNLTMSIDSLSSGEKQMISLFAKLYLYSRNKIVLIDEPELSLSLDWQRKILVDVLRAPLCLQVIAITHSPFVFDNPLDCFAKSMKSSHRKGVNVELYGQKGF